MNTIYRRETKNQADIKTRKELEESGKKDLLLAAQVIPQALENDDQDSLEIAMLAASEGFGMLKAARIMQGKPNENEVFYQDLPE